MQPKDLPGEGEPTFGSHEFSHFKLAVRERYLEEVDDMVELIYLRIIIK